MLKQIMIPVAAFAVTVTGASAFTGGGLNLDALSLSDTEVAAFEEARSIRESVQEDTQAVFERAGIDETRMSEIREEMREAREAAQEVVRTALESSDYDAFMTAIADTPLADVIDSEADFQTFVEAHALREDGDHEGAQALLSELGLERPEGGKRGHRGFGPGMES